MSKHQNLSKESLRKQQSRSKTKSMTEASTIQLEDEPEKQDFPEEKTSTEDCNVYNSSRFCDLIKSIMEMETREEFLPSLSRRDLTALPTKQYLNQTVVPILIQALEYISRERPPEPINALCVYLLKYKHKFEKYCNVENPQTTEQNQQQNE